MLPGSPRRSHTSTDVVVGSQLPVMQIPVYPPGFQGTDACCSSGYLANSGLRRNCHTLPLPNMNSTLPAAHWEPEPNTRGTFTIISSCISTLIFCAWSAVHANIDQNKVSAFWSRNQALVTALTQPEIMFFIAVNQWRRASELMQAADRSSHHSSPWSRVQGFYAVMGGFAIDIADAEPFLQLDSEQSPTRRAAHSGRNRTPPPLLRVSRMMN